MRYLRFAVMMGLLSVSCGDSGGGKADRDLDDDSSSDETGGDGDVSGDGDASGDGDGQGGSGGGGGLEINASLGLEVIDNPPEGESNLARTVLVHRSPEPAGKPVVSVNGVELEEDEVLPEFYRAPAGHIFDDIGAGKTLKVAASDDKGQTSIELPCPDGVQLTAPNAGDTVRSGETLTVSWSGDAHAHQPHGFFRPIVEFSRPNDFTGKWSPFLNASTGIDKGNSSSIEVSVPEVSAKQDIALSLRVPGPFITAQNGSSGICWLVRRIELTVE